MGQACPRTYARESLSLFLRRSRSEKAPDWGYGSLTRSFASMAAPSIASIFLRAAPDSSCAFLDAIRPAIGRKQNVPDERPEKDLCTQRTPLRRIQFCE